MYQRLWAPWRATYIKGKRTGRCVFCAPLKRHIIERGRFSYSILNIFPYNPGHVMVCPKRHVMHLHELREEELLDLIKMVERTRLVMERAIHPQGYNVGLNLGKLAGAGIWRHVHVHIVPRWLGDTNFMPILHDTKVMSVGLDELKKLLAKTAAQFPSALTSRRAKPRPRKK